MAASGSTAFQLGLLADALEVPILLAPPLAVRSLRQVNEGLAPRHGRLCCDHLAGRAAVALTEAPSSPEAGWSRARATSASMAGRRRASSRRWRSTSRCPKSAPAARLTRALPRRGASATHRPRGARSAAALTNEQPRRGWLQGARGEPRRAFVTDRAGAPRSPSSSASPPRRSNLDTPLNGTPHDLRFSASPAPTPGVPSPTSSSPENGPAKPRKLKISSTP